VLLRYDPFDLSHIQVRYGDKPWPNATVIDLARPYDRRVKPDAVKLVEEPDGQLLLSFLELAEQKRQAVWEADPVSYAQPKEGESS